MSRAGIHPDRPFYSEMGRDHRWWASARQRVLILTFPSTEEAEAWDANPTLEGLVPE